MHELLGQSEAELRDAGLAETSIRTYVGRSTYFVRWLAGDYQPGQRGMSSLPALDLARIRWFVDQRNERVPPHARDQIGIELDVDAGSATS